MVLLRPHTPFPDPRQAAADMPLAVGGDLSPERLLRAYRQGIFPWYAPDEPIFWWSPDPRMVLFPEDLRIRRSLARVLRGGRFSLRLDHAFDAVVQSCATTPRAGQSGTWITAAMRLAYGRLHDLGHAHSVECWQDDRLVGGLYGVAVGRVFFGESMFSHVTDASKVALAHLCAILRERGFGLIDCQMHTPHLASLGARLIPRNRFLDLVAEGTACPAAVGHWRDGDP